MTEDAWHIIALGMGIGIVVLSYFLGKSLLWYMQAKFPFSEAEEEQDES